MPSTFKGRVLDRMRESSESLWCRTQKSPHESKGKIVFFHLRHVTVDEVSPSVRPTHEFELEERRDGSLWAIMWLVVGPTREGIPPDRATILCFRKFHRIIFLLFQSCTKRHAHFSKSSKRQIPIDKNR
ncbi:hypothetical protein Sjap_008533 [Stephania japonica]|uniref:Uncharacterized protein n=1 Tax=Stephania japonica TaxID=461633 RepID=A0AAP0JQ62_9MAGN